jgi:hypothetical protein
MAAAAVVDGVDTFQKIAIHQWLAGLRGRFAPASQRLSLVRLAFPDPEF